MNPAAVLLACAVGLADWGPVRVDAEGVPLPPGVVARLGSSRFRYSGDFYDLRFTPDGKQLVGITARAVHVWDAATGLRLATHTGFRRITHLAIRPDGHIAVLVGLASGLHHVVVDRETGRFRQQRLLTNDYDDIAFSPDGSSIARRYGGLVQVLDADTGKPIGDVRFSISDIAPNHFAFSPDGRRIVMVFSNNWTEVRDVATGNMPFAGSAGDDESTVTEVAFSSDGQSLLRLIHANAKPYRLESVDLTTEKATPLHTFENTGRSRGGLIPSRDGRSILLAAHNEIARFDLAAKRTTKVHTIPHPTIVNRGTLSPDGKVLAVALSTCGIALYDAATLAKLPQSSDEIVTQMERGHYVADGRRLALYSTNAFQVLDATNGKIVGQHGRPDVGNYDVHPDGKRYARSSSKGVDVCDLATNEVQRSFPWKSEDSIFPRFHQNGLRLSANNFKEFRLWNVDDGRILVEHSTPGESILPSSDDRSALKFRFLDRDSEAFELEPINLFTGEPSPSWPRQRFPYGGTSIDANYTRSFFSIGRTRSGMFDLVEGRMIWTRPRIGFGYDLAVFSPDGRTFAIRQRRALQLLEVSTGQLRLSIPIVESQRPLAFSPDSRYLATIGPNAPIFLWDMRGSLRGHPKRLESSTTYSLWNELIGDDPEAAFRALRRLAAAPETTIPFVCKWIPPVQFPDSSRVKSLIASLDAPAFRDREAAMKALKRVAPAIAIDLRAARAATTSPEVYERLHKILATTYPESPESVRRSRAVELVEWCGTAEAKALLRSWEAGAPGSLLAADAKAALTRLR